MRPASLHRRLLAWILSGTSVFALGGGLVVHRAVRYQLEREADAAVAARCHALVPLLAWEHGRLESELEPASMPEFYAKDASAWFRCTDPAGRILVASPTAPVAGDAPRAPMRQADLRFTPPAGDEDARADAPPELLLTVAVDSSGTEHALVVLALVLAATSVTGVATVSLLAGRILERLLAPLAAVASFADRWRPDDAGHRIPAEGMPRELLPVCARLNDLADRMSVAYQRERRFAGDVAHELRTPLAELRALSDLARTWPASITDPAAHREQVRAVTARMEGVVNTLLMLNRHESGLYQRRVATIDLADAIGLAWAAAGATARAKALTLSAPASTCSVRGDDQALGIVLHNLIANAVEYAPAGSVIAARIIGPEPAIEIDNEAPGLAAADVARFGERFWRKDPSRGASDHCGLGLALSQAISGTLGLELAFSLAHGRVQARLRGFERAS